MNCRRAMCLVYVLAILAAAGSAAWAFTDTSMEPNYHRYQVYTNEPLKIVCDQALNPATVGAASIVVHDLKTNQDIAGATSLATTNVNNDTLIFTPSAACQTYAGSTCFPWAERLQVTIDSGVQDLHGAGFTGSLPYLGVFVATFRTICSGPCRKTASRSTPSSIRTCCWASTPTIRKAPTRRSTTTSPAWRAPRRGR